jgi:hypothetical protein
MAAVATTSMQASTAVFIDMIEGDAEAGLGLKK